MTELWKQHGACRGAPPGPWFSESASDQAAAKQVCAGCPVNQQCAEYGTNENIPYGIFGGLTARQRKLARQRRNQAA